MSTLSKFTSLIVLLTGALAFAMAMCVDVYEARMYLAFIGLAFLTIGICISVIDLAFGDELDRQREAQREAHRRAWR